LASVLLTKTVERMQFVYVVRITKVGKDPSFVLNAVGHSTTASRSTAYSSSLSPGDSGRFFPRLCARNVALCSSYFISSFLPVHSKSTGSEQDLTSPHPSFGGCAMFTAVVFFWKMGSMFTDRVFRKHLNKFLFSS